MVQQHQGKHGHETNGPCLAALEDSKPEHTHGRADNVDRHAKRYSLKPVRNRIRERRQDPHDAGREHKRVRPPVHKTDERENRTKEACGDHFRLGVEDVRFGGGGGSLGSIGPTRIVTGFGFFISFYPPSGKHMPV